MDWPLYNKNITLNMKIFSESRMLSENMLFPVPDYLATSYFKFSSQKIETLI